MLFKILYIYFILKVYLHIVCGDRSKVNVAFVIDRTHSMRRVINDVTHATNTIFYELLTNSSIIDEFVLVTFDDPHVQEPIVTKDKDVFRNALKNIRLKNGGSCPEYSMSGIEAALQACKPNSYIYVFTDASAADYNKLDAVRKLSQIKAIQVNFILTGMCSHDAKEHFMVYESLSEATSGQIFHLARNDVPQIFDYIIESVKNKKTILRSNIVTKQEEVEFTVDSKIEDVMISVSGSPSKVSAYKVVDSNNKTIPIDTVLRKEAVAVDKINTLKVGKYKVIFEKLDYTSLVISGSTSVTFDYGFSLNKPDLVNETLNKRVEAGADTQYYLIIKVDNVNKDVKFLTAELVDTKYNVIKEISLDLANAEKQFYVSGQFILPNAEFKVAINGLTENNEKITRISSNTIHY